MPLHVVSKFITKTYPCNIQRFFSIVKKMKIFMRIVLTFFLIFPQNIDHGYMLELPGQGGSNKYTQSMFWIKNKNNRHTPINPSFTI